MSEVEKYIVEEEMERLGWIFNPIASPDDLQYTKLSKEPGMDADFADWAVDSQRIFVETMKRLEDKIAALKR